jgi:transposase
MPEKKISAGKVLNTKSRRVRSRVAIALRMGAQSLHHAKNYLGECFRRITRKLGKPQAITATAHKLARIIFPPVYWPLMRQHCQRQAKSEKLSPSRRL